jgi:hypothetical protein
MSEDVLFDKLGTMLVQTLTLSAGPRAMLNAELLGFGDAFWRWLRVIYKGYWAGGRIVLTPTKLIFRQTALNRAFTDTEVGLEIPLCDIHEIHDRSAFLNRIIDVQFGDPPCKALLRCFGAKAAIVAIVRQRDALMQGMSQEHRPISSGSAPPGEARQP